MRYTHATFAASAERKYIPTRARYRKLTEQIAALEAQRAEVKALLDSLEATLKAVGWSVPIDPAATPAATPLAGDDTPPIPAAILAQVAATNTLPDKAGNGYRAAPLYLKEVGWVAGVELDPDAAGLEEEG